jgi:sterol desaturase/sphingolipid hydroxylase (fatty acid hydroxylase superfamily)
MLIKFAVVITLGIPVVAIIIFEILLNATAMFNHGNIRLPCSVDKLLRLILVTPDMHRVHHSTVIKELNSNFGFNIPWWDRLCGTYRSQPQAGHKNMTIGLNYLRDEQVTQNLAKMLYMPFKSFKNHN